MDPLTLVLVGAGVAALFGARREKFRYVKKGGQWRAYFRGSPPSRSHVLRDRDGLYVCWDRPLRTEAEARQVAKAWMRKYG